MTTSSPAAPRRYPGRLFLGLGLVVTLLGVVGYVVQLLTHRLTTPWYMPAAATVGVALVAISLCQAPTVWRVLALALVVLLAAATWRALLGHPLPPYTG